MTMRVSIAIVAMFLAFQCSAKEYPVLIFDDDGINMSSSFERLMKKKWQADPWLREENGSYITSCAEYAAAVKRGYSAPDSIGAAEEARKREYCSVIIWRFSAKPAKNNGLVSPICVEYLFNDLFRTVLNPEKDEINWGPDGIEKITAGHCYDSFSEARIDYNRYLEEPAELADHGIKSADFELRPLVQGDFDGDGWLDVIAELNVRPVFHEGEGGSSDPIRRLLVKISRVKDHFLIDQFSYAFDGL